MDATPTLWQRFVRWSVPAAVTTAQGNRLVPVAGFTWLRDSVWS